MPTPTSLCRRSPARPRRGEAWRPHILYEDGHQVIEFGGKQIRSAVREYVRIDAILSEQDKGGVDRVLLCPWVSLLAYDVCPENASSAFQITNKALSALAQTHPARISALGMVPLQDPALAARELERLMALPGLHARPVILGGIEAGGTKFVCAIGTTQGTFLQKTTFPTTDPRITLDGVVEFFTRQTNLRPSGRPGYRFVRTAGSLAWFSNVWLYYYHTQGWLGQF